MKSTPLILSLYLTRQFLWGILMVFGLMSTLILLIDAGELLRRAASHDSVGAGMVIKLAFLKWPSMMQRIIPFAILIGSILTLSRLTRTHELVVARSVGVSVWQFLGPAVLLALLMGIITVTTLNPLAAALLTKYEKMEAVHLKGRASLLAVSSSGLWLRQIEDHELATDPDAVHSTIEDLNHEETIVHAMRVAQSEMRLFDVIIFMFDRNDRFLRRIDAHSALLKDGYWEVKEALVTSPEGPALNFDEYRLRTNLTVNQIQESFSSPETLSFWELPSFIHTLEQAGFSAQRHRLYFQTTLALPLLMCSMVLIGAVFALRPHRFGNTGLLISAGVATGFVVYFLSDIVHALGLSGSLPLELAAWSPALVSLIGGVALVLHFEEG